MSEQPKARIVICKALVWAQSEPRRFTVAVYLPGSGAKSDYRQTWETLEQARADARELSKATGGGVIEDHFATTRRKIPTLRRSHPQ